MEALGGALGEFGASIGTAGRQALKFALNFALPPRCPACGVIVADDHQFCQPCWSGIRFLTDPCCERCGVPFEIDPGPEALCGPCLDRPPPFDRARAAIAYGDAARSVALKLKYGRRVGLAELIARHLVRHVLAEGREAMLLVPVPLHRWRIWGRGFNQSALIAAAIGRHIGVPLAHDLLLRTKATPPLKGRGAAARHKAVRGAFALSPEARAQLAGRAVLLIDDVHTSGATAEACARLLKRGGAVSVDLLCWARVLPDQDD